MFRKFPLPIILLAFLFASCGGVGPEPPILLTLDSLRTFAHPDSTRIEWFTNLPAIGVLDYGLVYAVPDSQVFDTVQYTTAHYNWLRNLTPDTAYYFIITAVSEDSQTFQSPIDSFFTP